MDTSVVASVSIWVDAASESDARARARELAARQAWHNVIEEIIVETDRNDYFPPCPGLDALEQAEREGIAWRLDAAG